MAELLYVPRLGAKVRITDVHAKASMSAIGNLGVPERGATGRVAYARESLSTPGWLTLTFREQPNVIVVGVRVELVDAPAPEVA